MKIYPFISHGGLLASVSRHKGILVATSVEKILRTTDQTHFIINRNIGYCDGLKAVMALKEKEREEVIKTPRCELWLRIINMTYQQGKSYYLVDGKQEVIERTVKKLKEDYPGIRIANFRNNCIKTEEERKNLLEDIVTKWPGVVLVAVDSLRQELLMEEMTERRKAVYQGLSGSSDVYTDNAKRAPQWRVRHNLKWAYRLVREPVRTERQVHLVGLLF